MLHSQHSIGFMPFVKPAACDGWQRLLCDSRISSTTPCGTALFAALDCADLFQSSPVQHIDRFICNADEKAYTSVSAEKDGLLRNIIPSEETYCIL